MASLGVFSQLSWYGVGDIDECWIIATYWPLVAAGVLSRDQLPSIAAFRKAAGKPDRPGPTGGSNRDLMIALKKLVPAADAQLFVNTISSFRKQLQSGYIASLSVLSKDLPKYLQFGFLGSHQISVILKGGKFYVANPLAKEGSALIQISERDLLKAAGALFGDNRLHAVLIRQGNASTPKAVAAKALPVRPRDLNAPIIVRDYIDPFEARRQYLARHRSDDILG